MDAEEIEAAEAAEVAVTAAVAATVAATAPAPAPGAVVVTPPSLPAHYRFSPGKFTMFGDIWTGDRHAVGLGKAKGLMLRQLQRGYRAVS